jgi:hypothetical protein
MPWFPLRSLASDSVPQTPRVENPPSNILPGGIGNPNKTLSKSLLEDSGANPSSSRDFYPSLVSAQRNQSNTAESIKSATWSENTRHMSSSNTSSTGELSATFTSQPGSVIPRLGVVSGVPLTPPFSYKMWMAQAGTLVAQLLVASLV